MEIISAIVRQLTSNLSMKDIKGTDFEAYYVDHTAGVYPVSAAGDAFVCHYFQSKGDPVTDLHEDMAADGATA